MKDVPDRCFNAVLIPEEPLYTFTPTLANMLFLFENIKVYRDMVSYMSFHFSKNTYIDFDFTDGLSYSAFVPEISDVGSLDNWIETHPKAVLIPPFIALEKMGYPKKNFVYEHKVSDAYPIHYHDVFLDIDDNYKNTIIKFINKWKTVNYEEKYLTMNDYLKLKLSYKQNIMYHGLEFSKFYNVPLVTDESGLVSLPKMDVASLEKILALQTLSITVPNLSALNINDILEIREKLRDLLPSFWNEMKKLTYSLKLLTKDQNSPDSVVEEAKFIVESKIDPILFEVKKKL